MSTSRMMQMLEHGSRSEQRHMDLLKIYQEALGVIAANKGAINPALIAHEALMEAIPIFERMKADPWPPASDTQERTD